MQREVNLDRDVYCVMGLPIDAIDMAGAVQRVRDAAFNGRRCFVSTPNLNFVMAARDDAAFRDSVLHSDLCLADGMPLVWVSRLLGLPIRERVSGAGLFEKLLNHPGPPVKVYFFGGPEGAAEAACRRVNQVQRGLHCVGFDTPGFGSVEQMSSDAYIDRINQSGAQFVIVALGAKKGQAWIEHNLGRLRPPVVCHLGAVVNFAAGTVQRAPRWVQAIGAEWLWRTKEEPTLWRRYWTDGRALARTLGAEVIPLMYQRYRCARAVTRSARWSAMVSDDGQRTVLSLSGDWTHTDIKQLRELFRAAYASGSSLDLNLARVTHLDSACLGLIMLANGAFARPGWLTLSNVSADMSNGMFLRGAGFLLKRALDRSV